jgi:acyl-CoA hydrolase
MTASGAPRHTPAASRTVMTELVLPEDTNTHGSMFGGRLLALADKAAAMAAIRHCRMPVVTASMDRVDFVRPVRAGMIVILTAELTAAFRTSMEVAVTVEAENPLSGVRETTCRALITVVAIDEGGQPSAIPTLEFDTAEERLRAARGAERRAARLASRGPI